MIDPRHPDIEKQLQLKLRGGADKATAKTNAERQREFRERQKALGLRTRTFLVTDDEAFYLERTLLSMREEKGVPAMLRNALGQLKPIDV